MASGRIPAQVIVASCPALFLFTTKSHVCFKLTRSVDSGSSAGVGKLDVARSLSRRGS